jgi:hypothetical protein
MSQCVAMNARRLIVSLQLSVVNGISNAIPVGSGAGSARMNIRLGALPQGIRIVAWSIIHGTQPITTLSERITVGA